MSMKELIQICNTNNITNFSKKNKKQLIELINNFLHCNTPIPTPTPTPIPTPIPIPIPIPTHIKNNIDTYTKDILIEQYNLHKQYVIQRKTSMVKLHIKFRLPSIPEDISENIIKFILHKTSDNTSKWSSSSGDLISSIEGIQECKSFTSCGPCSFTPSSIWDVIYFLDARKWLDNKYILYKISLSNSSDIWKNIKINKKQTFNDQCMQGRRPRINWDSLYIQIKDKCEKIFDGTFESIFIS